MKTKTPNFTSSFGCKIECYSGIVINSILFGSFHQNSNYKWNNCLSIDSIIDYFPNLKNNRLWEILQIYQFEDSF